MTFFFPLRVYWYGGLFFARRAAATTPLTLDLLPGPSSSRNGDPLARSITLHLRISCPSSPATPTCRPAPQIKIEVESESDEEAEPHARRDSETML